MSSQPPLPMALDPGGRCPFCGRDLHKDACVRCTPLLEELERWCRLELPEAVVTAAYRAFRRVARYERVQ